MLMMMSFLVVAMLFFISGVFAREMLKTVIKELQIETERLKKANDFAESQAK